MCCRTNLLRRKPLSEYANAREALASFCEPFGVPDAFAPDCAEIQPAGMSPIARRLLAHREHMTLVLEAYYAKPVDVRVQKWIHEGDFYSRRLVLTPQGANTIVMAGFMRLNFAFMSDEVKDEILSRRTPLGRILVHHNVLRRIEPLWFVQFPPASTVFNLFGISNPSSVCGRLATIFCDGEPAIELMETVLNFEG